MPRLGTLLAALVATLAATAPPAAAAADFVPGEIVVRFKGNAGGSERAAARRNARVELKRSMRLSGTQLVKTQPGQDLADALAQLRRDPRVRHAIRNGVYRKSSTTNDPQFGSLWGLHNTGTVVNGDDGNDDADIDAPEAWDLFNSAPDTVVAVVDTGVQLDHPDLKTNLWTDAQGAHGHDFIDGDSDPTDLDGHGTHVAGTIAAQGNNGVGTSGVAWDAQIMAVRVLDENGSGSLQTIADGFTYAAQQGARVVNASLGGGGDAGTKAFYDELFAEFPDTLFVVAAGNEKSDNDVTPAYPCNSTEPNVVCVAATDNRDALAADFSNFGKTTVDLAAPGQSIRSAVPTFAPTGLAHDFSSGIPAGWSSAGSVGGTWTTLPAFTGYPSGHWLSEAPLNGDFSFSKNERLIMTSAPYDLSGKKGCTIAYDLYYEYDLGNDGLLVESSANGGPWAERAAYTGTNDGIEQLLTNLDADGATSARFRFFTVANGTTGGRTDWFGSLIDNVRVRCAVANSESYAFFAGTSMAAPHVAGVATLLFGARSDADVADVRGWLLDSGDLLPSAAEAGKLVTGRRLNAHKALLAAGVGAPVLTGGAVEVQHAGAKLLGTVNPGGTATSYKFVYGEPGGPTTATAVLPAGSGTSSVAVSAPITGLTPETTYEDRLVAIQGGTETPGLVRSFRTSAIPVKRPPALSVSPAIGIGNTVATIEGSVHPNGKPATVLVEFGKASGSYSESTDELVIDSPSDVTVELTDLAPGTRYFYRLRGHNADGEATSQELSFTTTGAAPPPPPPTIQPPVTGSGGPTPPPGGTSPPVPPVSVVCKLSKRKKVTCKAGATVPVKVGVLVMRGSKVFARGSASRLVKGKSLKMKTLRRVRRGRYRLQITVSQDGAIVTTLKKSIRL